MKLRHATSFFATALFSQYGLACSPTHVYSPEEVVAEADAIYRAQPVELAEPRKADPQRADLLPLSQLKFKVVGVLKGAKRVDFISPGSFVDDHDLNRYPAPYEFVRSGGKRGACFASTYVRGQEYLVFLKAGNLYWAPIAPTNEEIAGDDDPWLVWVSSRLRFPRKTR